MRFSTRRRAERGSISVELALVILPLATLVLGAVEVASGWKANTEVSSASRQGARVVTHLGTDNQSDREALRSVVAGVGGSADRIERVIIFDETVNPDLGTACNGAAGQRCNRYESTELDDLEIDAVWGCGAGAHDRNWCPTSRSDAAGDPDTIGVVVVLRHEYISNFFGMNGMNLSERTVMRVEPGA